MKKLIAIAVMIALVAGAVFADSSVGGSIDVRFTIGNVAPGAPNGAKLGDIVWGGNKSETAISLSGQNDEGSIGGKLRIKTLADFSTDHTDTMFVWWQPLEQLRIFLGIDSDGKFETGKLTSWAMHQGGENYFTVHDWDYWRGIFPGNWDTFGLAFSIYPIEGLDINLAFHTSAGAAAYDGTSQAEIMRTPLFKDIIGYTQFNLQYNIDGVGSFLLDWTGPMESFDSKYYGTIGASFYMAGLVDGLDAQLGFSTGIGDGGRGDKHPIMIGAAAAYSGGEWGLKFRLGFGLNGEATRYGYADGGTHIVFTLMPWYDMGDMKIAADIGASIGNEKLTGFNKNNMGWWFAPYVKVPMGPGFVQAGMKFWSGISANYECYKLLGPGDTDVKFQVPVRFVYSF